VEMSGFARKMRLKFLVLRGCVTTSSMISDEND
jgi:hypothetical protein